MSQDLQSRLEAAEARALACERSIAKVREALDYWRDSYQDYMQRDQFIAMVGEAAKESDYTEAAREIMRKAAAFDVLANLRTEWSGWAKNGRGEYTFIPDVMVCDPNYDSKCISAPTLLDAIERLPVAKGASDGK
jgi:hypothetical protein